MDNTDWQRVAAMFATALDEPTGGRDAFLKSRCGDDDELRAAVERLLQADAREHSLLDGGAVDALAVTDFGLLADQRVGAYRIIRQIGAGGMGAVYLAERADGEFEQTVALKLMRPGDASDELAHRFRMERQVLARREHPAIARLIDGGVTGDGWPYFTMEYVNGIAIDDYCHKKQLSLSQRLRLFMQVLGAVAYAQQQLVVHRDLKPSNILVTDDGSVKLLDFGIAKVLAGAPLVTPGADGTVLFAMTPQYAAPEQVRGEAVSTATDVYALGVVLYQLMSGIRPYQLTSGAPTELEQLICQTVPPLASSAVAENDDQTLAHFGVSAQRLRRHLRGDLDTICAKALRKEPERRYPSAQQMLDDLERHLSGWPVRARPDTLGYRLRKYVRRHTRPLLIVAVALLTIAGLLSFYTGQLSRASARARQSARKAESVSSFLIEMFKNTSPLQTAGEELTVRALLDRGAERIDEKLRDEPEVRVSISDVIGQVYQDLGHYEQAETLYKLAIALRRELHTQHPDLAQSLRNLASVRAQSGKHKSALAVAREATAMRAQIAGRGSAEFLNSQTLLSGIVYALGDVDEAEKLYREALAVAVHIEGANLGSLMNDLALLLQARHQYAESVSLYRRSPDWVREHRDTHYYGARCAG